MLVPLEADGKVETGARRFILSVAVIFGALLVAVAPACLVLHNTGETLNLNDLAERQVKAGTLYLPYFEVDEYTYKLALYRLQKPELAVIGSSLPLPLGSDLLSAPTVNLGRAMPTMAAGPTLLRDMVSIHTPRTLLIVLDFWWFNAAFENEPRTQPRPDRLPHWSFRRAITPYLWLAQGKLTPLQFGQLLSLNPLDVGREGFGIQAILTHTGFARDGSRIVPRANRPTSYDFDDTLSRIAEGRNRFEYGERVDEDRWQTLLGMLRTAEQAGITAIVVLPPLARRLQDAMGEKGKYGYVAELRQRLKSLPLAFDFLDPETVGSSDCEFLSDGFHLAAVGWARISQSLRVRLPASLGLQFGGDGADATVRAYEKAEQDMGNVPGTCKPNAGRTPLPAQDLP